MVCSVDDADGGLLLSSEKFSKLLSSGSMVWHREMFLLCMPSP